MNIGRHAEVETFTQMSPVFGVASAPHLTIQEALEFAQTGDKALQGVNFAPFLYAARTFAADIDLADPMEPLSDVEDVMALHTYTAESPIYQILNERLRDVDRDKLKPWFPYLRRLLSAVLRLPTTPAKTVYRGVKERGIIEVFGAAAIKQLPASIRRGSAAEKQAWREEQENALVTFDEAQWRDVLCGKDVTWWGFSSCTTSLNQVMSFVGNKGERVMIHLESFSFRDIQPYSAIPTEAEVLLMPGTVIKIMGVMKSPDGLCMIQAEEQPMSMIADIDDLRKQLGLSATDTTLAGQVVGAAAKGSAGVAAAAGRMGATVDAPVGAPVGRMTNDRAASSAQQPPLTYTQQQQPQRHDGQPQSAQPQVQPHGSPVADNRAAVKVGDAPKPKPKPKKKGASSTPFKKKKEPETACLVS
jgi:hypothetical protein